MLSRFHRSWLLVGAVVLLLLLLFVAVHSRIAVESATGPGSTVAVRSAQPRRSTHRVDDRLRKMAERAEEISMPHVGEKLSLQRLEADLAAAPNLAFDVAEERISELLTSLPIVVAARPNRTLHSAHEELEQYVRKWKPQCPFQLLEFETHNPPDPSEFNKQLVRVPEIVPPAKRPPADAPALKIPRILMMTNKQDSVPRTLQRNVMHTIGRNPGWELRHFSDASGRDFMERNMPQVVIDAFDALIPGAFKADLFRYCYLYINGGVYIDADQLAIVPLDHFLLPTDEFVSVEDNGLHFVYNAFLAVVPQHPIIAAAIEDSVTRIMKREYGVDVLDITGPQMMGRMFKRIVGVDPQVGSWGRRGEVRLLAHVRTDPCAIGDVRLPDGQRLFWSRYPEYKSDVRWLGRQKNYWDMWRAREIYNLSLPVPAEVPARIL